MRADLLAIDMGLICSLSRAKSKTPTDTAVAQKFPIILT